MRTRPGICQRKARYADEDAALKVAAKAPFPLRPYRCDLCRNWHLTSRTKGMKLPRFEIERRRMGKGKTAPSPFVSSGTISECGRAIKAS